jgi:hypothetical protein
MEKTSSCPEYRAAFEAEWERLIQTGQPFTSEDVTKAVGYPYELGSLRNNVVGALTATMVGRSLAEGRLVRAHTTQSQRPSAHAHRITVYQGIT